MIKTLYDNHVFYAIICCRKECYVTVILENMRDIILIAHNLRSCHNVGSLLRTAEGLSVERVFLTGYTPYPIHEGDVRMPHIAAKLQRQINKTALGAQDMIAWQHADAIEPVIEQLRGEGYNIAAVEQSATAIKLPGFNPADKLALIVGREVEGVEPEVLALCDNALEIPMFGRKESFNVVQATAMALYHCRFR
jgi:23S rRNA (guanosine2251-2'-O)-methyltransferase